MDMVSDELFILGYLFSEAKTPKDIVRPIARIIEISTEWCESKDEFRKAEKHIEKIIDSSKHNEDIEKRMKNCKK